MVEFAYIHKDILLPILNKEISKDRAKFFQDGIVRFYEKIEFNNWEREEFVSISQDGNLNGFIVASINRYSYSISDIGIIGFPERNKEVFNKDIKETFQIFISKYRKINFSCFIGNYAENKWDYLVEMLGGRVVGIYHQDVILRDGKYYDRKVYEILRKW